MRLTDLGLQRLATPETGQKIYRDDAIRGFGVRVSQGGGKSFVLMYGERRKLKTLGRYPRMSLKEARLEAMRFLVEGHLEPAKAQQALAPSTSVKEALEAYLQECSVKNKPRTVNCYRRHLKNHLPKGKLGMDFYLNRFVHSTMFWNDPAKQCFFYPNLQDVHRCQTLQ